MRRMLWILVVVATVEACAIDGDESATPSPGELASEHFLLQANAGELDARGLDAARQRGERFYRAIVERLQVETDRPIEVSFEGSAQRPDGTYRVPFVDSSGRIHLFRYSPSPESYFGAFPHEIVHALRIDRIRNADWFFEEGFAEFTALRVGKSTDGFPWYGAPLEVAAGQWIAHGEYVPLGLLRVRHRELSLQCMAQSYTLRSSFFDYLGKTHGDERVFRMARDERAGELDDYEAHFGKPLDELEHAWRAWLDAAYREVPEVESLARRYREDTPVRYMTICREGEHF